MKRNIQKSLFGVMVALFPIMELHSQDDKLGTKVIDIVKPYTPTVADAFKQRELAPTRDTVALTKKKINYTIYSVPVASTFVPDKGRVTKIPMNNENVAKLYDSYVALGFGSYTSFLGDAYVWLPIDNQSGVSLDFQHLSSQNNVKNMVTDSKFANTSGQVAYRYANKDYFFGASANVAHRLLHWYGIENPNRFNINDVRFRQNYVDGGVKAHFGMNNSIFRRVDVLFNAIGDDFDSSEIQFQALPSFEVAFPNEHWLVTQFDVNYLNGSFKQQFLSSEKINNQWLLLGAKPSYHFLLSDFSAKIGFGAYYISGNEKSVGNFKIYPDVQLDYDGFGDVFTPYLGATGEVRQNSYREQSRINPFVSPTLTILPTITPYKIFLGAKGLAMGSLSYDVKGYFARIENLPLFRTNHSVISPEKAYQYDNSFHLLYDKAMNYGASLELKGSITSKFTLGTNVKVDSFVPDTEKQAWNIPMFQTSVFAEYQILPNWNFGTDIFYVGERKDMKRVAPFMEQEVSLDGFFDLSLYTDYTFLKRWTIFLNANNLAGNNYQKWANYPTQGLQILGGLKYQF